jgi:hypothetical protein
MFKGMGKWGVTTIVQQTGELKSLTVFFPLSFIDLSKVIPGIFAEVLKGNLPEMIHAN